MYKIGQIFYDTESHSLHQLRVVYSIAPFVDRYVFGSGTSSFDDAKTVKHNEKKYRTIGQVRKMNVIDEDSELLYNNNWTLTNGYVIHIGNFLKTK